MSLTIVEDEPHRLAEYARVSIGFTVAEVFDDQGIEALLHGEPAEPIPLRASYWKNYDSYPGNRPTDWRDRFDISHWTILAAYRGARRVGGAVVIGGDLQVDLLRDCLACALLWDLRVSSDMRGQGIGSALLHAAELHARRRGDHAIRVETQNVNVPACRVYERNGFQLERATPGAYVALPHEVQLLWRKTLT